MLADLKRLRRNSSSSQVEVVKRQPEPKRWNWVWLVAAVGLVALLVAGGFLWRGRASQGISSVAVLPFVYVSNDSNNDYLSDGKNGGIHIAPLGQFFPQFYRFFKNSLEATPGIGPGHPFHDRQFFRIGEKLLAFFHFLQPKLASAGDKEQTFIWLDKAFAERAAGLQSIKIVSDLDKWHSDPRYVNLLR